MNPEQLAELLKLATSVGGTVWAAAVRQALLSGWVGIISSALVIWLSVYLFLIGNKITNLNNLFNEGNTSAEEWQKISVFHKMSVDNDWHWIVFASYVVGILFLFLPLGHLCDSLVKALNPEWGAISLLIDLVK